MTTFVLAADHRNSLRTWLRELDVAPQDLDLAARSLKTMCVEALSIARTQLLADETPMLLVDEEYGADAIARAKRLGLMVAVPVERSGQHEFQFEHGPDFGAAIEMLDPSVVKALVRYNPSGDPGVNARARSRLAELQAYVTAHGKSFMLELLVPATDEQRSSSGAAWYEDHTRPELTVQAIEELSSAGLRPDWWKLEGCHTHSAAANVAAVARRTAKVGCLVLGRGQSESRVRAWVETAASVEGFVGFAIGRTLWSDAFRANLKGELNGEEVPRRIAAAYLRSVSTYRCSAAQIEAEAPTKSPV